MGVANLLTLLLLFSTNSISATATWQVQGKRIALHAQSSGHVHGFVAGSEYTCLGLKHTFELLGAAHVRIFSPGLYGPLKDELITDNSSVWDSWDLVIIEGWFDMIETFIHAIRSKPETAYDVSSTLKSPIVLYYCLDVYSDDYLRKILNLNVDGYLTNSESLLPKLKQVAPSLLMHLAVDPTRMTRIVQPRDKYLHNIVYVGQYTQKKESLLPMLREAAPFGLAIYGFGWGENEEFRGYYKGVLPVEDLCEVYSGAKVVLGTTDDLQKGEGMINNRMFEALACGSFLVNDYFTALEDVFGAEGTTGVFYYKKSGDLKALLSNHDNPLAQILQGTKSAQNDIGIQLVNKHHTYNHRVKYLTRFLGELETTTSNSEIQSKLGCINPMKVGIVYLRPTSIPFETFDNGFVLALKRLQELYCYQLTWINLADFSLDPCVDFASCGGPPNSAGVRIAMDVNATFSHLDVVIVKSNWNWFPDTFARQYLKNLKHVRLALAISGVAEPPEVPEMLTYDVLYYETDWYEPFISQHPNIEHAFGVDTSTMKPIPSLPKRWDKLSIGNIVNYKRLHLFADKLNSKAHVGDVVDTQLAVELAQRGVELLPSVPQHELVHIINSATEVHIPAGTHGGGERAVLEARACGVKVVVEDDNPKLQGLLHSPVWDINYYAFHIQRGITRMFSLGRGRSSIELDSSTSGSFRRHVNTEALSLNGPTVLHIAPTIADFELGVDGFWCLFIKRVVIDVNGTQIRNVADIVDEKCTTDQRVKMFVVVPQLVLATVADTPPIWEVQFKLALRSNIFVDTIRETDWIPLRISPHTQQGNGPCPAFNSRMSDMRCDPKMKSGLCREYINEESAYLASSILRIEQHGAQCNSTERLGSKDLRTNDDDEGFVTREYKTDSREPDDSETDASLIPDQTRLGHHKDADDQGLPRDHNAQHSTIVINISSREASQVWSTSESYNSNASTIIDYTSKGTCTSHTQTMKLNGTISLWGQGSIALQNTRRRSLVVSLHPGFEIPIASQLNSDEKLACDKTTFVSISRFLLISLFEDEFRLAYQTGIRFYRQLGSTLWLPATTTVQLITESNSGEQSNMVSHGYYLLVEYPVDAIKRFHGKHVKNLVVAQRTNDDTIKDVGTGDSFIPQDTHSAAEAVYDRLLRQGTKSDLERFVNLDDYMLWLAANSVVLNGDFIDEVFFHKQVQDDTFQLMGWDLDTLFRDCHLNGVRAATDHMLYCAESALDKFIVSNVELRERFKKILNRVLVSVSPDFFCGSILGRAMHDLVKYWDTAGVLKDTFENQFPNVTERTIQVHILDGFNTICKLYRQRHAVLLDSLSDDKDDKACSDHTNVEENTQGALKRMLVRENGVLPWDTSPALSKLRINLSIVALEKNWINLEGCFLDVHHVQSGTRTEIAFNKTQEFHTPGLYAIELRGTCAPQFHTDPPHCSDIDGITGQRRVLGQPFAILDNVRGESEHGLQPWIPAIHIPNELKLQRGKVATNIGHTDFPRSFLPKWFPDCSGDVHVDLPLALITMQRTQSRGRLSWVNERSTTIVNVGAKINCKNFASTTLMHEQITKHQQHQISNAHTLLNFRLNGNVPIGSTINSVVPVDQMEVKQCDEGSILEISMNHLSPSSGTEFSSVQAMYVELRKAQWQRISQENSTIQHDTRWGPDAAILVDNHLTIKKGAQLVVELGTVVVLSSGIEIIVEPGGSLIVSGTIRSPVTITSRSRENWRGISAAGPNSKIILNHAFVMKSGSGIIENPSRLGVYGHRKESGLFMLTHGASLNASDSYFGNGAGVFLAASNASISLTRTIVQRFKSGGELFGCDAIVSDSLFTEFPDKHNTYSDGDNDALYIVGGNFIAIRSTFAHAKDDCIDSGTGIGGNLWFEHCIFDSCFHEGVALTNKPGASKHVVIRHSVFVNNQQGLELGWSTPNLSVFVHSCLFLHNQVGVRFGDNYDGQVHGLVIVMNSTFVDNQRNAWRYSREEVSKYQWTMEGPLLINSHPRLNPEPAQGIYMIDCEPRILPGELGFQHSLVLQSWVLHASNISSVGNPTNNGGENSIEFTMALTLGSVPVSVTVRGTDDPFLLAKQACVQADDTVHVESCVSQLTTLIESEIQSRQSDAQSEVEQMKLMINVNGREHEFRLVCGEDSLLKCHKFCKSHGLGYSCLTTMLETVLSKYRSDPTWCSSTGSNASYQGSEKSLVDTNPSNVEASSSIGSWKWSKKTVWEIVFKYLVQQDPTNSGFAMLEYGPCDISSVALESTEIPLSITCVYSNIDGRVGAGLIRGEKNLKTNSALVVLPSTTSFQTKGTIDSLSKSPDFVDFQIFEDEAAAEVLQHGCNQVLDTLGNVLTLSSRTFFSLSPSTLERFALCAQTSNATAIKNDGNTAISSNLVGMPLVVTLRKAIGQLRSRGVGIETSIRFVGFLPATGTEEGGKVVAVGLPIVVVELVRMSRVTNHHMNAKLAEGWRSGHYTVEYDKSVARLPRAVRKRDGKHIQYTLGGLTLNSLLEIGPDDTSRELLRKAFAVLQVTEDMAPWNIVFGDGGRLVYVDEQIRQTVDLNINYMYTIVHLWECDWDSKRPVESFQQCVGSIGKRA